MSWENVRRPKIGCAVTAELTSGGSVRAQLQALPRYPVLFNFRADVACYVRQGDATVEATVNDTLVPEGTELVVETDCLANNYVAIYAASAAAGDKAYFNCVSTTASVCA
jgi:hypothetical protein